MIATQHTNESSTHIEPTDEELGRLVREAWVERVKSLPNDVPLGWTKPYDELSPFWKEMDNHIGRYLYDRIKLGLREEGLVHEC